LPISISIRRLIGILSPLLQPKRLWSIADYGERRGRPRLSRLIYSYLSRRRLNSESDFLYAALSALRKNRIRDCLSFLERGLTAFPISESLHTLYATVALTHNSLPRYFAFSPALQSPDRVTQASLCYLFQLVISSGNLQAFLLNYADAQYMCTDEELRSLEKAFLKTLNECLLPFSRARELIFYGRFLDLPQHFVTEVTSLVVRRFQDRPEKCQILRMIDTLTPPMVLSGQVDSSVVSKTFIDRCHALLDEGSNLLKLDEPLSDMSSNWMPWQGLLCSGMPKQYPAATSALEAVARRAWPQLYHATKYTRRQHAPSKSRKPRIRIGFAVHDSMPMMSGLAEQLDSTRFETVFLRPGRRGSSRSAHTWPSRVNKVVEFSDSNSAAGIRTISRTKCDILVAGPSMGSILFPMFARLAPLQMILLEPHWLNGTRNIDYYVSWGPAEPANPSEFYASPVAFLKNPPYWIEWPALAENASVSAFDPAPVRRRLLGDFSDGHIYLCASTPPKIRPEMDSVFASLLRDDPKAVLVFTRADYPPSKTLQQRLRSHLPEAFHRVLFLPTLKPKDAHALLLAVDCCLDSFPLTGMSSSFDGILLGAPIVTLPSTTPFGRWTSAIYDLLDVQGLTARSTQEYLEIAMRLASDLQFRSHKRQEILSKASQLVERRAGAQEFQHFLLDAWERYLKGQKATNWLSGEWAL
jgi:predicted O-linked N-acetylglucosamine transferase (SPINDLY family)